MVLTGFVMRGTLHELSQKLSYYNGIVNNLWTEILYQGLIIPGNCRTLWYSYTSDVAIYLKMWIKYLQWGSGIRFWNSQNIAISRKNALLTGKNLHNFWNSLRYIICSLKQKHSHNFEGSLTHGKIYSHGRNP